MRRRTTSSQCVPHLHSDVHGRAVNEALTDIEAAVAVELSDVPRGAGWSLIEAAEQGPCREVVHHAYLGLRLSERCILSQIRCRPELVLGLFSEPTFLGLRRMTRPAV